MEVVNALILLHSSEIHLYSLQVALYIGTVCKINTYSGAVWYLKHIIVIIMLLIIIIIDFFLLWRSACFICSVSARLLVSMCSNNCSGTKRCYH